MKKVYCYGMICPSTVYLLSDDYDYPKANGYGEVKEILQSVGGEAVNTAIMLSKLGIKSVLDGTWIIKDKYKEVKKILKDFDIDISRIRETELKGPSEIVVADRLNRTCFGNFDTYQDGEKKWNIPILNDIKKSSIVALDPFYPKESLWIAKKSIENNIPYVTLDSSYDDFVAQNADVIIISQDFISWTYPEIDKDELFKLYQNSCSGLVIFTSGSDEVKYSRRGQEIKSVKPYNIDPVDTTAAGDTFRSGIIYGILNEMSDEDIVNFANAVSACVCLSVPHSINAVGLNGIIQFMKDNKS